MHRYRELKLWQKSIDLVTCIYEVTRDFPSNEKFGLVSQINRSAVSIPSNIAEGAGRNTDKEFIIRIENTTDYFNEPGLSLCDKLNELTKLITELQKMNFSIQSKLQTRLTTNV